MRALPLLLVVSFLAAPLSAGADGPAAPDGAYPDAGPEAGGPIAPEADDREPILAPLGSDLAAIQETLALPAATWHNDRDGDKVFDTLEARFRLPGVVEQPVIVTFVQGTDVSAAMQRAQEAAGPLDTRYVYEHYGGFAADLRLDQVMAVAALPEVRQVEWSQPGTPELDTATVNMNVRTVQDVGVTGDRDGIGITGNDSVIAILDTGFDGQHVDLKGKFLHFIDWSDDGAETEPYDSGSHGTHVASIAAGLGKGDPAYTGVAPGAALVGFLISSSDTKGAAIASIDWILEHRNETHVDVLTISFGFGTTVDGTDALELAMDKAWAAGVTNFKSTGNSGPNRGTVTVPGGARGIIGTASMYEPGEGGFRLSSFSSRGPTEDGRTKPDIAAPGSNIMAASAGSGDGYVSLSGTSMASPFAAGVAALVKAVDPALGPDDVRRILFETAHDWGPEGHDVDYGNGRLDALRAVQQAALEKAVREQLGRDTIARYNVTGAEVPVHAHGVLGGNTGAMAEFTVEDTSMPLAVTLIAIESAQLPEVGAANAFLAVVLDPDGIPIVYVEPNAPGEVPDYGLSADPNPARQQTVAVVPTSAGDYTIRLHPGVHDEVMWDVSAGLPPTDGLLAPVFGNGTSTEGLQDEPGPQGDDAAASFPAVVLLVAALVVLAMRRR